MPNLSFDGSSLILDGHRLWPVAARLDYAAFPADAWADRLRALRDAGFNTVDTAAWWHAHQPAADRHDFTGRLDVARFVRTAADLGLFVILRAGPHVPGLAPGGGLPPWLDDLKPDRRNPPMRRREGNTLFLAAAGNFYKALFEQVGKLQITERPPGSRTAPPRGTDQHVPGVPAGGFVGQGAGPLIAVQLEDHWCVSHDAHETAYLGHLLRHLRQAGAGVPVLLQNQLWNQLDGTLHFWRGADADANTAHLRQLRAVNPDAPVLADVPAPAPGEGDLPRAVGAALAAGAIFRIDAFDRGAAFEGPEPPPGPAFTPGSDHGLVRFASHFGHVLAHLDPAPPVAVADPVGPHHPLSITHRRGARGELVVLQQAPKDRNKTAAVLLPDGRQLVVPLAAGGVTALLLDVRLGTAAHLDYTSLPPLMLLEGRLLVLVGPARGTGVVSIDHEHLTVTVPAGATPLVETLGAVTLVVLNDTQAASAYPFAGGLAIGAAGTDADQQPLPARGHATQTRIAPDGTVTRVKVVPPRRGNAPALGPWRTAPAEASINAPAHATPLPARALHHTHLPTSRVAKGGRTLRIGGAARAVLLGPSATAFCETSGPQSLRPAGDITLLTTPDVGNAHGPGRLLLVDAALRTAPQRHPQPAPDAFAVAAFAPGHHQGEAAVAEALLWHVKPKSRKPVLVDLSACPVDAVLRVNGDPVAFWQPPSAKQRTPDLTAHILLDPADDGPFTGGTNAVELALFAELPDDVPAKNVAALYPVKAELGPEATWTTQTLRVPAPDAFSSQTNPADGPTWHRATFTAKPESGALTLQLVADAPGALVINGHHAGATVAGPNVLHIAAGWLAADGQNELTLFDEGGPRPRSIKLARI